MKFQLPMVSGSDQKAKENFYLTVLLLFYNLQRYCLIKNYVLSKVHDNTTIQGPTHHKRFFSLQICASTILLLLILGNKNI